MTSKFQAALTAVLLVSLVAGGMGSAAAATTDINSGENTIVNDNDLVDIDDTLNNISTNVLGVQVDDNNLALLSSIS